MHNAGIGALKMDAVYLAFDVDPARLLDVLPAMRDLGFGGVNLTVPLKEVAFHGLEDLDISARRLGAVNTVEFLADGTLRGHNTDGYGFLVAIREAFDASVQGRSVFVLGTGGAGRAVAITCAAEGAARLMLSDMDESRGRKVAAEIAGIAPGVEVKVLPPDRAQWSKASLEADLVVQATPVGMKSEDNALLGPEAFREGQMAFDMIYMYPQTTFMQPAISAGAHTANGLGMLLHQGARAFEIWTGRDAAVDAMRTALEKAVYE